MNKILLTGLTISIVAMVSVFAFSMLIESASYVYTASDITKANPNIKVGNSIFSMEENMDNMKESVVLTLSGTTLSVGDPIDWTVPHRGEIASSVPVTIKVDKISKNMQNLDLKQGQEFTFYMGGMYQVAQLRGGKSRETLPT